MVADRPNVILVMTDQHRGDCLSAENGGDVGGHPVLTPNLDQLAADGARFSAGKVFNEAVCLEDIMPTVLELVGIDVPSSVDGTSLVPLLTGERPTLHREFLHLESAGIFHALTDGKEKYIWFADDGAEQFFDLTVDPHECHDLASSAAATVDSWRDRMIVELTHRPERFVRDGKLVAGVTYEPMMPR